MFDGFCKSQDAAPDALSDDECGTVENFLKFVLGAGLAYFACSYLPELAVKYRPIVAESTRLYVALRKPIP
jgi:hypothetical protein